MTSFDMSLLPDLVFRILASASRTWTTGTTPDRPALSDQSSMTGYVEERSGAYMQVSRRDTEQFAALEPQKFSKDVSRHDDERGWQTAADEIWKVRKIETTLTPVRPPASSSVRMGEY
jgi:hypothetical protein